MKIGIDMGHSLSGQGTGACGIVKETDINRKVGKLVISKLQSLGHSVVNCTTDYASTTNDQLASIVSKANAQSLDLFVSIHLNAATGEAYGTEVYTYLGASSSTTNYAKNILNKLVACGFYNRGVKQANYYVLRKTNASAILIELFFCTSQKDVNIYGNNPEKLANAIVSGITGVSLSSGVAQQTSTSQQTGMSLDGYNAIADVDMNLVTIDRSSVLGNIKKGDKIKIKDFSNELKMMLVEVNGVIGFIPCDSNISLINKDKWINGGSIEKVYGDNNKAGHIDTLPPHKTATVLKKENGMYFIVYENDQEIRAGFVEFGGC